MKAKAKEWVMLKQKLQNARYYSTAIPLYDEWGQSISGIDQRFIFNDESDAFPSKKKSRQSIWKFFEIGIKIISDKSCFLSLIIRFYAT